MIRVDLHVHTNASVDSSINPKLLVDSLYSHPIIKGVAVTDHNTIEGCKQVQKLARAYNDLLIIPGIEVTTQEGDIILLGVEEKPTAMQSLQSVVDFAKQRAALIVIPHPYRVSGIGDAAEKIAADAVEIMNPWASHEQNKLAEQLARARGLPGVAGSDAHKPDELWVAFNEVDAEPDVADVLKAIKNGHVKAVSARHI
jgi:predicted metal-dependent phosphoesterase TrpH